MQWEIKRYGEQALLVNFEQRISPAINAYVNWLHHQVQTNLADSIKFSIPAYCSLTLGFDHKVISYRDLENRIIGILESGFTSQRATDQQIIDIPVCYEKQFAPDLERVCSITKLTEERVIELHTGTLYLVYMLGYVAGFGYLGEVPKQLECPRLSNPRTRVTSGSVGIAGLQTGIYPTTAPGGWNIIGRTPQAIVLPDSKDPFLLSPGARVRFYEISSSEFNVRYG